ncbi:radical SAM protein [Natroniella sp. ANB-PHB2]|uniref:radical SAM protein n=1 Tax=Natroniella sp. ANB-PHB2 TaxID=3384444 RepID=UPI0038D3CD5D
MRYEGRIYRPPSEAKSVIIQTTVGCSHNKCTFCNMYNKKQFKVRNIDEIIEDLKIARDYYESVSRIFLADGNALCLKTEDLKIILSKVNELFPECKRVGTYSSPRDILNKSVEELKELRNLGLKIAYLGIESGSDEVLKNVNKGVNSKELIKAGNKVIDSNIKLSVTLISGLGGKANWKKHARESAKVVNEINPDYLALLTLFIDEETEIYDQIQNNRFKLLEPQEIIIETKELLENLKLSNSVFRSNHASNYLSLAGVLNRDKDKLLKKLDEAINDNSKYKPESLRGL